MHQCGDSVLWSQCVVGKFVRSIVVISELISRRNHCAQTASPDRAGRSCENTSASRILGKGAATPMLFICDKGASFFDDLELEGSRHREVS